MPIELRKKDRAMIGLMTDHSPLPKPDDSPR